MRMLYVSKMLKIIVESDKILPLFVALQILLSSVLPFISIFLIKRSIDMFTSGVDYLAYFPQVMLLLGLSLIGNYLQTIVNHVVETHINMFGTTLFIKIFNKSMELDYEMLLDKSFMEKRELALKGIDQTRFNGMVRSFMSFTSSLLVIAGIAVVLSRIELWILGIVFAIVIINARATAIRKEFERSVSIENVPYVRKIQYFMSFDGEPAFGKEIRLYNMLGALNGIYDELQKACLMFVKRIIGVSTKGLLLYHSCSFALNSVIYGYLGYKLLALRLITVGDFSMYLNAITTFNTSIQEMINAYIDISNNGEYLKDYFDYMSIKSRYDKKGGNVPVNSRGDLIFTLENVSFHYPYQTEASLKNVNLTLNNKERLAIVGENGAGKTTLIKLLMRLYEPTEGRILLNGVDIREIDYRQYLSLFASVFQDFKLFAFHIVDNVTSFKDGSESNLRKIRECLDKAGLLEKIDSLNKGLDTYLYKLYEEDGVELSGGEAQKLAIARALYKDAPVIILDEPTAALDPRSEYEIYTRFFSIVENKTSVFITHRLSSTRFCDKIIVLKKGKIVETGAHEELLARNSYYAELFNMQAQFYTDTKDGSEPVE